VAAKTQNRAKAKQKCHLVVTFQMIIVCINAQNTNQLCIVLDSFSDIGVFSVNSAKYV